jgi:ABC-type dipeptide/oligopeptide/nickel transport system ATPase component
MIFVEHAGIVEIGSVVEAFKRPTHELTPKFLRILEP